jgi:hypothetical protein
VVHPRCGQPPGFAHDGEVAVDEAAEASARDPRLGYRTRLQVVPAALDVYRPATSP